jgi:hypothetical protein
MLGFHLLVAVAHGTSSALRGGIGATVFLEQGRGRLALAGMQPASDCHQHCFTATAVFPKLVHAKLKLHEAVEFPSLSHLLLHELSGRTLQVTCRELRHDPFEKTCSYRECLIDAFHDGDLESTRAVKRETTEFVKRNCDFIVVLSEHSQLAAVTCLVAIAYVAPDTVSTRNKPTR